MTLIGPRTRGSSGRYVATYATLDDRLRANSIETPGPLDTPCRLWAGEKVWGRGGRSQYPKITIRVNGKTKKFRAHRVALEQKLGRPLQHGYEAAHLCHVSLCIEPSHLEEQSRSVNARARSQRRAVEKRNAAHIALMVRETS
jgi:hypothetical protein